MSTHTGTKTKEEAGNRFSCAWMMLVLLVAYISGALLVTVGAGYLKASLNNPDTVVDYTQTDAFKQVTGEYMDAFYKAVSEELPLYLPYSDTVAYFAYGLDTNRVFCSDPTIYDMPSFDDAYMESSGYVFYVKYSSGQFRGNDKASGITTEFEYSYTDAAGALFDGTPRYYADAAVILAVAAPDMGLTGYASARLEFYLLKNGAQLSFTLLGVFLLSCAVLISGGKTRRTCEKLTASICSWIFCELKLAVILWWAIELVNRILDGNRAAVLLLAVFGGVPLLYLSCCELRYAREKFFRTSLTAVVCGLVRELFGTVSPVGDIQLRFRRRAAAVLMFGVFLPALFFVAVTLLLGTEALRYCLAFYIVLYSIVSIYIFNRYGRLVDGIGKLEKVTACFSLGTRLPEIPKSSSDLEPLIEHLRDYDAAVDAAADMKYRKSVKGMGRVNDGLNELKTGIAALNEKMKLSADYGVCAGAITELYTMAESLQQNLVKDSPVAAPVFKRIDLLEVLDHVLDTKIAEFSAARLKVEFRFPDPPCYITADAAHIAAALDELLTNAAMYAVADTNVKLQLFRTESSWKLTIENMVSDYNERTAPGSVFSVGLVRAEAYLRINGGRWDTRAGHGMFTAEISLPAAR